MSVTVGLYLGLVSHQSLVFAPILEGLCLHLFTQGVVLAPIAGVPHS